MPNVIDCGYSIDVVVIHLDCLIEQLAHETYHI